MRRTIFQISRNRIEENSYIQESDYYDFLPHNIFDFFEDADEKEEIEELKNCMADRGIEIDTNANTMRVVDKKAYFEKKYVSFIEKVHELGNVQFEDFVQAGGHLDHVVYGLNELYEDAHGDYIDDRYTEGYFGLRNFDSFVRGTREGDLFYLGGVVQVHM